MPVAETARPDPLNVRRHDLDALRAIAMGLGLVIHGCMSFMPGLVGLWPVNDIRADDGFGVLVSLIHGFRMPLFFLLSGFFTAMLYRKRGLSSLLGHRFKRIFVPLVLGFFTIIPLTWGVAAYIQTSPQPSPQQVDRSGAPIADEVWMAAATGDLASIQGWTEAGFSIDEPTNDGSTALGAAILFGRAEVAEVLLQAEADPKSTNVRGETPTDMLAADWATTQFVAGLFEIKLDQTELWDGRQRIAESLAERLNDSQPLELLKRGQSEPANPKEAAGKLFQFLTEFPLLHHLWFLSFLCWLVAGFAIAVGVGRRLSYFWSETASHESPTSDRRPRIHWTSPWTSLLWAVPLTAMFQYLMPAQSSSFGPATSSGLLPMPVVLGYYAVFFGWGAIYFDASPEKQTAGSQWSWLLPACLLVLFPLVISFKGQTTPVTQMAYAVGQVAYAWWVSWALMGMFRQCFSKPSPVLRYVSDSSYWVYLIHLPLIFWLQFLVRDADANPWLKMLAVVLACVLISTLSYHVLVRYTPIGTLLNGKRRPLWATQSKRGDGGIRTHE